MYLYKIFSHFYILKLLFLSICCWYILQILCRYKWHACRLTCSDKFRNVPTKFWKSIIWGGGGGGLPPPPPATLNGWQCQGSRYMIWPESRGKFKDLVCLVVFYVELNALYYFHCVSNANIMNRYFSSFQKSRGGGGRSPPPPRKIRGGDTSPPRPPRDRRHRTPWPLSAILVRQCRFPNLLLFRS